jgi:hypothetical protein
LYFRESENVAIEMTLNQGRLVQCFNVTAVAPMWTDQRFHALRLGGHVLSRHFRYYIPEFFGQIVVQTPIVVR